MAVKFTASLDGVGHSELSNWLLSSSFSNQYGPTLLGHLYFDTGASNFFGGRGAVSIQDKTGFFSRLAPGEVGTTTTPPAEPDRQLTPNDGTAPIRFGGNVINARANWAKLLDVAQDIQLTGKATGGIVGPLFRGDATAVVTVTALSVNAGPGGGDTVVLPLTTNNIFVGVGGIATDRTKLSVLLNEWGIPNTQIKMGPDGGPYNKIVNMADPQNPQDAVTLKYLQDNAAGIEVRTAVRLATTAALPASTFTVGTNTIEANANGGPLTVDATAVVLNDRLLIKDQVNKISNGIYDVTVVGDGATKWKLTRSADSDTTPELQPGMYFTVTGGTSNLGSSWVQSSPKPFVLNTNDCLFSLFSSSGGYLGGQGIQVLGKTIHFVQGTPYTQGVMPYASSATTIGWTNVGISGQPLISKGGGAPQFEALDISSANNVVGVLRVVNGGTGQPALTLYNVLIGNGTSPVAFAAPGTLDYPLCSNGPAAYPSFKQLRLSTGAVTGILPVEHGGTERDTLAIYNLLAGNNTDAVALIPPVATSNVPLASSGAAAYPTYQALVLSGAGLSGVLPVSRGGTERTSLTQYSVLLGAGAAAVNFATPGTVDYVLTSNGPAANPTFRALPAPPVVPPFPTIILTPPTEGFTITQAPAWTWKFDLSHDLLGLESLLTAGYAKRAGTTVGTWTTVPIIPWNEVAVPATPPAGWGTVTSVDLNVDSGKNHPVFKVDSLAITTSGFLNINIQSQTANTFWAAPSGSAGKPAFRAITLADISPILPAPTPPFDGSGIQHYVARWASATSLRTGLIRDDTASIGINVAPSATALVSSSKVWANTTSADYQSYHVLTDFSVESGAGIKSGIKIDTKSSHASGQIQFLAGLHAVVRGVTAGGTIDTLIGVRSEFGGGSANSVVRRYAFYATNVIGTANTSDSNYGYYSEDLYTPVFGTGMAAAFAADVGYQADRKYGLYLSGLAQNYILGRVGIGFGKQLLPDTSLGLDVNLRIAGGGLRDTTLPSSTYIGTNALGDLVGAPTPLDPLTVVTYAIQQPGTGITVSDSGVFKMPGYKWLIGLANDLAALEALDTTGYAKRTGPDAWSLVTQIPTSDLILPVPLCVKGEKSITPKTALCTGELILSLVGDEAETPTGGPKYYGTNASNVRGFHVLAAFPTITYAITQPTEGGLTVGDSGSAMPPGYNWILHLVGDLKAVEAMTTSGYVKRTESATPVWSTVALIPWGDVSGFTGVTSVRVTVPTEGLTGTPTVATSGAVVVALGLSHDLNALEGLTTTGYAKRTGVSTWTTVTQIPQSDIVPPPPPDDHVIGITYPASELLVNPSTVTNSGTFGFSWVAQAMKKVFMGPVSGIDATPTFRLLQSTDLPTHSHTAPDLPPYPIDPSSGTINYLARWIGPGTKLLGIGVTRDDGAGVGIGADPFSGVRLYVSGKQRITDQLESTLVTGTSPFKVASTTLVTNLNAEIYNGYKEISYTPILRAGYTLLGGGTLSVNGVVLTNPIYVKWTARIISICNGNGTHYSTSGYFQIDCPLSGTITVVGGSGGTVTATGSGVPLNPASYDVLYYILPVGGPSASVQANFRIVRHISTPFVPPEWVRIAATIGDGASQVVTWFNGERLNVLQSLDTTIGQASSPLTVVGAMSINPQSPVSSGTATFSLVGDVASATAGPKYYGYDAAGTRGFYNLPAGSSGTVDGNGMFPYVARWDGPPGVSTTTIKSGVIRDDGFYVGINAAQSSSFGMIVAFSTRLNSINRGSAYALYHYLTDDEPAGSEVDNSSRYSSYSSYSKTGTGVISTYSTGNHFASDIISGGSTPSHIVYGSRVRVNTGASITNLFNFYAERSYGTTPGTITNRYGFWNSDYPTSEVTVSSKNYGFVCQNLTQGTERIGFKSEMRQAAGTWAIYAEGSGVVASADSYIGGRLGVGLGASAPGYTLDVLGNASVSTVLTVAMAPIAGYALNVGGSTVTTGIMAVAKDLNYSTLNLLRVGVYWNSAGGTGLSWINQGFRINGPLIVHDQSDTTNDPSAQMQFLAHRNTGMRLLFSGGIANDIGPSVPNLQSASFSLSRTNGSSYLWRWRFYMTAEADTGTGAVWPNPSSSDLNLYRYQDIGTAAGADLVLNISRRTGIVDFKYQPTLLGIGLVSGLGTPNYLARWTGTGTLGFGLMQDDASTLSAGVALSPNAFLYLSKTFSSASSTYGVLMLANRTVAYAGAHATFYSNSTLSYASGTQTDYRDFTGNPTFSGAGRTTTVYGYVANTTISAGSIGTRYGLYVSPAVVSGSGDVEIEKGIFSGVGFSSTKERWNLYVSGSAANYINGALSIGNTTDATASGSLLTLVPGRYIQAHSVSDVNKYSYLAGVTTGMGLNGEGSASLLGPLANNFLANWKLRGGTVTVTPSGPLTITTADNCYQPIYGANRIKWYTILDNSAGGGVVHTATYEFADDSGTLVVYSTALNFWMPYAVFSNGPATKVANIKVEYATTVGTWIVLSDTAPTFVGSGTWRGQAFSVSLAIKRIRFTISVTSGATDLRLLELGWASTTSVQGANTFGLLNSANTWGQSQTWKANSNSFSVDSGQMVVNLDGPSGINRILAWQTSGLDRWKLYAHNATETGANNAGSDLYLASYADNGAVHQPIVAVFNRNVGNLGLGAAPSSAYRLDVTAVTGTAPLAILSRGHLVMESGDRQLRFWSDAAATPNQFYAMWMSAVGSYSTSPLQVPSASPPVQGDYNIFFRIANAANRGFVFQGGAVSNQWNVHMHGGGNTYFRKQAWAEELGTTLYPNAPSLKTDGDGKIIPGTLGDLGGVGGSGTIHYVPKWVDDLLVDPASATLGNSRISDDGMLILLAGNSQVSGTLTVTGATTLQSTLGVTSVATFNSNVLITHATDARLIFNQSGAAADFKRHDLVAQTGNFYGRFYNDALTLSSNWLGVTRHTTGYQANRVDFQTYGNLPGVYSNSPVYAGTSNSGASIHPSSDVNVYRTTAGTGASITLSAINSGYSTVNFSRNDGTTHRWRWKWYMYQDTDSGVTAAYSASSNLRLYRYRDDGTSDVNSLSVEVARATGIWNFTGNPTVNGVGLVSGSGTANVLPRWNGTGSVLWDSGVTDDDNALTVNRRVHTRSPSLNANYSISSSQCEWWQHSSNADPTRYYKIATFTAGSAYGSLGSKAIFEVHCGQYQSHQRTSYYIEMGDRLSSTNPMRYYVRMEGVARDSGSGIRVYAEPSGLGANTYNYHVYLYTLTGFYTGTMVTAKNTGYARTSVVFFPNPTAETTLDAALVLDFDTTTCHLNVSCFGYQTGATSSVPSEAGVMTTSVFNVAGILRVTPLVAPAPNAGLSMIQGGAMFTGTGISWLNQGMRFNGGIAIHDPADVYAPGTNDPTGHAQFAAEMAVGLRLTFPTSGGLKDTLKVEGDILATKSVTAGPLAAGGLYDQSLLGAQLVKTNATTGRLEEQTLAGLNLPVGSGTDNYVVRWMPDPGVAGTTTNILGIGVLRDDGSTLGTNTIPTSNVIFRLYKTFTEVAETWGMILHPDRTVSSGSVDHGGISIASALSQSGTLRNYYDLLLSPSFTGPLTSTAAYGARSNLAISAGTMTSRFGYYVGGAVITGTGVIGAEYGFTCGDLSGPNLIYRYGFLGQVSKGTGTRWNLYMQGDAPNYLAGYLGIAKTAPTLELDVVGSGNLTGNLGVGVNLTVGTIGGTYGSMRVFGNASTTNPPYIDFYPGGTSSRRGYIGWASAANHLILNSLTGWQVTGGGTFDVLIPHTANQTITATARITGAGLTDTTLITQPLLGTNGSGNLVGKTLAAAGVAGSNGTAGTLPVFTSTGVGATIGNSYIQQVSGWVQINNPTAVSGELVGQAVSSRAIAGATATINVEGDAANYGLINFKARRPAVTDSWAIGRWPDDSFAFANYDSAGLNQIRPLTLYRWGVSVHGETHLDSLLTGTGMEMSGDIYCNSLWATATSSSSVNARYRVVAPSLIADYSVFGREGFKWSTGVPSSIPEQEIFSVSGIGYLKLTCPTLDAGGLTIGQQGAPAPSTANSAIFVYQSLDGAVSVPLTLWLFQNSNRTLGVNLNGDILMSRAANTGTETQLPSNAAGGFFWLNATDAAPGVSMVPNPVRQTNLPKPAAVPVLFCNTDNSLYVRKNGAWVNVSSAGGGGGGTISGTISSTYIPVGTAPNTIGNSSMIQGATAVALLEKHFYINHTTTGSAAILFLNSHLTHVAEIRFTRNNLGAAAGVSRWILRMEAAAAGENTTSTVNRDGSDLALSCYRDDGAGQLDVFNIDRATGKVDFKQEPSYLSVPFQPKHIELTGLSAVPTTPVIGYAKRTALGVWTIDAGTGGGGGPGTGTQMRLAKWAGTSPGVASSSLDSSGIVEDATVGNIRIPTNYSAFFGGYFQVRNYGTTASGIIDIASAVNQASSLSFSSGNNPAAALNRWQIYKTTDLESTGDLGANLAFSRTSDNGSTSVITALVDRKFGIWNFTVTPTVQIAALPAAATKVSLEGHTHNYQPYDEDLTQLAALGNTPPPSSGYAKRIGPNQWVLDAGTGNVSPVIWAVVDETKFATWASGGYSLTVTNGVANVAVSGTLPPSGQMVSPNSDVGTSFLFNRPYYVISVNATTIKLAASRADALSGVAITPAGLGAPMLTTWQYHQVEPIVGGNGIDSVVPGTTGLYFDFSQDKSGPNSYPILVSHGGHSTIQLRGVISADAKGFLVNTSTPQSTRLSVYCN